MSVCVSMYAQCVSMYVFVSVCVCMCVCMCVFVSMCLYINVTAGVLYVCVMYVCESVGVYVCQFISV